MMKTAFKEGHNLKAFVKFLEENGPLFIYLYE